jgi:uncharacterized protein YciI
MRRRDFQRTLPLGLSWSWLAPLSMLGVDTLSAAAPDGLQSWFIFLETGRPTPADPPAVAAMQRGHIDNFKRLFALQRLQAAGPLADPSRTKRGIVVVTAASVDELRSYFQPDDYVREGYMRINAQPAIARQPLHTEGIDDTRIEEVRIVLIGRPSGPAEVAVEKDRRQLLQTLIDRGTLGAWYSLADGPLAEVLLARGTDSAALQAALAPYPGVADGRVSLAVWPQWISPGVVGPR